MEGRCLEAQRRVTGTPVDTAATHNVLVRCTVFEGMERLFDERLGLRGSEDSEFFRRVGRAGHRMVWADEAVVYECIPASRTTLRWLLQRAYRIANGQGNRELRRLQGMTRARVLVTGLRCLARGALGLAASVGRGPVARVRALRLLVSGVGWLSGLLGVRYREYERVHGR